MQIPVFLMAIMVANGCNSGSLSPLAPTGIIVSGLMSNIGLPGLELRAWFYNFLGHAVVAFAGYFIFGGWQLLTRSDRVEAAVKAEEPLTRDHWITLGVIALIIAGVVIVGFNIGMAAFTGAVLLGVLGVADQESAIKKMPWGTILMVCGVTVLIGLLERTSGLDIFTNFLTRVSTPATIIPLLAIILGLISSYSSTSGVVLPAFLPLVPGLAANLGAGLAVGLAMTMNVAAHLVDVSPLSTTGALTVAGLPTGPESRRLFNQLLAWGFSMTLAGAVFCWIFFA
jgi:di/tricarboxylate transporter